jgi:hypothetical protein
MEAVHSILDPEKINKEAEKAKEEAAPMPEVLQVGFSYFSS